MLVFFMLSFLFLLVALVDAHPAFEKRQSNSQSSSSSSLPPQIWIPILVLAVVIVCISVVAWSKRSLRATLAHISQGSAAVSGVSAFTPRELTADQLAGNNNSTPAPRTRRTRRPASQISTTSLPAYMKDPGDQELVIYRGPVDMEDMPVHQEDEEEDIAERYGTMPVSPQDMPLTDDDSSSMEHGPAQPPGEGMPLREEATDPRGATPSYFEVVDLNEDTGERRHSLLGFLNSRNRHQHTSSVDIPLAPTSHARNQSSTSVESTGMAGGSTLSLHRAVSNSFLSNLRRKKSTNTLNSVNNASTLSVNSISAPLTHTLQKTEFTYPRSGPTPEQVKLISSRESLVKFGRPYGADAIAFAASTSRQALEPSPPEFEESQQQLSEGPGSATPVAGPSSEDSREIQSEEETPPVLKIETAIGKFRPLSTILSATTPVSSTSNGHRVSLQEDRRGSVTVTEGNRRASLMTTIEGPTTEGNRRASMVTFTTAMNS